MSKEGFAMKKLAIIRRTLYSGGMPLAPLQ